MKYLISLVILLFVSFGFAADSLTVSTVNRAQRIDTIKARLEAPSWSYDCPDTNYVRRNCLVWVRLRWVNPGNNVIVDTTIMWRPSDIGIESYKYVPRVKLHFTQN